MVMMMKMVVVGHGQYSTEQEVCAPFLMMMIEWRFCSIMHRSIIVEQIAPTVPFSVRPERKCT